MFCIPLTIGSVLNLRAKFKVAKPHVAGFRAKFDRKLSFLLVLLKVKFRKIIFNFI
ncbi:hypothetical protein CAMSH0001_1445 [Campylobacter showae RM3277]|uniref:Uncharacterized protein n=1 Tax=Campylobacter showae RM3277 TaxID=553219 RepID=C6RIU8_9BACT|nr:hypothetical protein CAMSH0001_1445 [Campylobacter showae RM3277]